MPRIPHTFATVLVLVLALAAPLAAAPMDAEPVDIIWDAVVPPEKPATAPASADPASTALLVLDMEQRTCNMERRARCLDTVPRIADLLARARAAGVTVIHSLTPANEPETILPRLVPRDGEPVVSSSVNKFWRTDLQKILEERGVKTVIVVGTAAHGAVLHTATAAAYRGFSVVLPVDCLSAADPYVEQAAVHLLATGPATRKRITITRSDMVMMP